MTAEQSIRNIERVMGAVNAAARNTPKPDPRADLVDLFEAHAETHDDKSWIEVEEAVDLVMDRDAEITDEQVEVAAKAARLNWSGQMVVGDWASVHESVRVAYRSLARAVLVAATEAGR